MTGNIREAHISDLPFVNPTIRMRIGDPLHYQTPSMSFSSACSPPTIATQMAKAAELFWMQKTKARKTCASYKPVRREWNIQGCKNKALHSSKRRNNSDSRKTNCLCRIIAQKKRQLVEEAIYLKSSTITNLLLIRLHILLIALKSWMSIKIFLDSL